MTEGTRWLKVREAADRARCGPKTIYRAARSGHLRAARIGGRRELRFLDGWIDLWLLGQEKESPATQPASQQQGKASNAQADKRNAGLRAHLDLDGPIG